MALFSGLPQCCIVSVFLPRGGRYTQIEPLIMTAPLSFVDAIADITLCIGLFSNALLALRKIFG
jgi:hypothetical protein